MVKRFDNAKKISVKEYKNNSANQGRVAIFDFANSELIAEGDDGSDWFELELLCEELRKNGDYRIVIVPQPTSSIRLFRRVLV